MKLLKNKKDNRRASDKYLKDWKILIDTLPLPVSIVDTSFNIIMTNAAMTTLLGDNTDILDRKCYQVFHHSEHPVENCPMLRTLRTGKCEKTKLFEPFLKKTFMLNTAPIIIKGNMLGIIHTAIEINEMSHLEDDNSDLINIYGEEINKLKTQTMNAQRGRDAFLNMLEDINESYNELEDLFLKLVHVMVNILDAKSPWTKGHSERVATYAEKIAMEMLIDADEIKNIRLAGLLHDIGKIGTYDYLLDKPGKLTREEFDIVKEHPSLGANILKEIKQLKDIIPYIKYHHEKLDGNGYPTKLKGEKIPLGARILHVADSFDSMTSDRPYRPAPGINYALSELNKFKGSQFDHTVVEAFLKVLKEIK
jgi:putative nucleotidyltransferase with HDIG domain